MNSYFLISLLLSTVQLAQIPKGGSKRFKIKSPASKIDYKKDLLDFLNEFEEELADLKETNISPGNRYKNKDILAEKKKPIEKLPTKTTQKSSEKLSPTVLLSPSPVLKAAAKFNVADDENDIQRILDEFERDVVCLKSMRNEQEETSNKLPPKTFSLPSLVLEL